MLKPINYHYGIFIVNRSPSNSIVQTILMTYKLYSPKNFDNNANGICFSSANTMHTSTNEEKRSEIFSTVFTFHECGSQNAAEINIDTQTSTNRRGKQK